ncbi:trypsin-like peptidase domain-containing protein [Kitasatospora purpeofusca]|uniref:effector-associated domain 2-containing protein n=1 Tax=Kitasatospora purpeofusca TaxID=67352 RepID=UPI0036D3977D
MTGRALLGLAEAEALRHCTVTIDFAGSFRGSGFLVAPGLAVTAAHVLVAAAPTDRVRIRHACGDHDVAADRIRLAPAQGDRSRFHPFPDLALLSVPGWTDHPVARLAAEEAEPDTVLTALGYSTYTPGPGAQPDTLALRVVGRAADFVGVRGDGIRDGHSGSMLVGADGLVRGVLKGSRSYQRDEGGWFTPVGALAALLAEAGVTLGPPDAPAAPPSDGELVAALMAFRLLRRSDGRFLLLDAMGRRLGLPYAFEADELPDQRLHLHGIVDGCRSFRDGRVALRALVAALEELAPDDGALDGLRTLVGRAVDGPEGA